MRNFYAKLGAALLVAGFVLLDIKFCIFTFTLGGVIIPIGVILFLHGVLFCLIASEHDRHNNQN